jgi:hypothetical protein
MDASFIGIGILTLISIGLNFYLLGKLTEARLKISGLKAKIKTVLQHMNGDTDETQA